VKPVLVALSTRNEDGSVPISDYEKGHNLPYTFCGLKYFNEKSVLKGDWISCQQCKRWFHEHCIGAQDRNQFICEDCEYIPIRMVQIVPSDARILLHSFRILFYGGSHSAEDLRRCNQKFPDWPPGARNAYGTALCH
jgi:hypothetical protein